MMIGELSKRTGVSERSLRYYEKKRLISPSRLKNGYREFKESDIEKVQAVQLFLELGLNTDEIYPIISCNNFQATKNNGCTDSAIELYSEKLKSVREQIQHLRDTEQHLEILLKFWREEKKKEERRD
ncbi:MerR family transcriptional regulator [Lysinibacillus sp. NPDC092081]|uniref:MerR family transcriptional regulator n=1 Tax=Lysinibacillus sp. NPDC092081 TaxID=3364131 RepID=UPI003824336D